jgi:hypothetical protein
MVTLIEQLNRSSAAWAEAMWAVAWQAVVLIGLVAVVCWMLRWQAPALRYWLWLILAAKLLAMPFWRMELPLPAWFGAEPAGAAMLEAASPASASASVASARVPTQMHEDTEVRPSAPAASVSIISTVEWATWLLLVWLAVVVFEMLRVGVQYVRCGDCLMHPGLRRRTPKRWLPSALARWGCLIRRTCAMWASRVRPWCAA